MAKRYIGDAVVETQYNDAGDYRGTVRAGGVTWKFEDLHAPAVGLGAGVAYDSPVAYDRMAAAAVSFGSYPCDAADRAVAETISDATVMSQYDNGEYDVKRKKAVR